MGRVISGCAWPENSAPSDSPIVLTRCSRASAQDALSPMTMTPMTCLDEASIARRWTAFLRTQLRLESHVIFENALTRNTVGQLIQRHQRLVHDPLHHLRCGFGRMDQPADLAGKEGQLLEVARHRFERRIGAQ